MYVQYIFLVFSGLILSLSFFYSAYRIQKQRGVVVESKIVYVLMLLISVLQFLNVLKLEVKPFIWYGIVIGFLGVSLFSKLYFTARDITIYETTKDSVVTLLTKELTKVSVPYEIKEDNLTDETTVDLYHDKVTIKVEAGLLGEERKNIKISFKKWWRLPQIDEIQYRLMEVYRQEREEELFWKPMLVNCILGLGVILGIGYFAWTMNPMVM